MKSTDKAIGIDFGGTSIKFGVVQGKHILADAPLVIPSEYHDPADLIDAIADTVNILKEQHQDIVAVGAGVPGFVDTPTGRIHNLSNVPGWTDIPFRDLLKEKTGLPAMVENDANAMGVAEWKQGAGVGFEHLICITLGTGVGGAIIVNNQLVRGSRFVAGEPGQTSIYYNGRIGAYNNAGALEDYIGNREFAADSQQAYQDAGIDKDLYECSPAALATAAHQGDVIALACWDDFARKLACTLANCCWLLNPEAFVIGGGLSKAGPILFGPLKKHLNSQLSSPFKDHLQLIPAHFSNEAGIIGAATLAIEAAQ
ncbi:ROK family protein [Rubritalea marina]|uniref:ROK family protein n=1 Tax=Rubritalea marina TaxID=361055 RepID=UPI00037C5B81|nr:ROK family protein [Rubritalea marina]